MNISAEARNHNDSFCVYYDRFIPSLHAVVRAIKDNGARAVAQLNHRGQLLRRSVTGAESVGPTDGLHPATGEPVRAVRGDEIKAISRAFFDSARRLRCARYEALETHAANGNLFQQFFTERFNKRTDQYGGSPENRSRFLIDTVRLIRDALPDFSMMVWISATEYVEGGYSEAEAIALALAAEGVIAIDLSGRSNENPLLSRYCIQPPLLPRRCLEPFARLLKAALRIPVIIAGRIITAEDVEGVLQAGSADFISWGRALIADPHWCLKALGIVPRPCISCNVCFEPLTLEEDVACVQNPMVGTEFGSLEFLETQRSPPLPPEERRRILVIGCGVAGAEAARLAAGLGHSVEVWERAADGGGQVPLALASPDKEDVEGIWSYRVGELGVLWVSFRTSMELTTAGIVEAAPDLVVVATGSIPRTMPVSVDVPVLQSRDVLLQPTLLRPGSNVTIVGGRMVGIEPVDTLGAMGCRVTVVEMGGVVAREMARNNRFDVMAPVEARGALVLSGPADVVRASPDLHQAHLGMGH